MYFTSPDNAHTLLQERAKELHREAEMRRLAAEAQSGQPTRFSIQGLMTAVRALLRSHTTTRAVDELTEEELLHAEAPHTSPQATRHQSQSQQMYQRIAQGNSLFEAELAAEKMR
jgi:hypothetical protein